MSLQKTELGWLLACKRRGASHRRNNVPCQDAYARSKTIKNKSCIALAVADGHGDSQHDLSEQGAILATTLAVKKLVEFCDNFANSPMLLKKNFKQDFPRLIGRHWRQAVLKDAATRFPLQIDNSKDISQLIRRYGTTLLVALIQPDALLLGQIGDGDILCISPEGDVKRPLNQNKEFIGNVTYSLSSPGADKLWQTATLTRHKGNALLLATDGLSNAFTDEAQFHVFARSLLTRIKEFGIESVDAAMPQWLDDYSEHATGDDITLLIFNDTFPLPSQLQS
ncbi:PP2C family serine/threonine-protein phosphatase [Candidatus Parabeggiatoa sp. HSG14]|uniref:PP2C family serine/threonine-protein phosphatase n=1 Tax=Candidatus Parabeggiatoa sp. HSG14 TaxID=3055593 RepID=UPI0025A89E7B|nr:PP2C family serine/threonine-protein phosphatase [Thiotrichales bacterium HSG14]